MLTLFEVQQNFLQAILSEDKIRNNTLSLPERLEIYRDSIFQNILISLKQIYPTIVKLVGEDFFQQAARAFVRACPSTYFDLQEYGGFFSVFIADYEPAKSVPYLSEIAKFEWGCHQIRIAPRCKPLNFSKLASIDEVTYKKIIFKLNPACKFFNFNFPVLEIWRWCQLDENQSENFELGQGGYCLLMSLSCINQSNDHPIEFKKLSTAEKVFLAAMQEKKTFAEVCQQTLMIDKNFSVEKTLQQLIQSQILIDLELS